MNFKMLGFALGGAVGLAVSAIKSARKSKRETANAWFYSSQFRDDISRKVVEDFKLNHPGEELSDELRTKLFFEELEKYKKDLI